MPKRYVDRRDLGGDRVKYVVVQRTGFVPYFLSTWYDGTDRWDCLLARAIVFDGLTARRIANRLNAKSPAAPLPVAIEVIR
jgi:hypothetical protein